ncbi:MAG: CapA family protein [Psychrobium sp.]
MKYSAIISTLLLTSASVVNAADISLSGSITDEANKPLANAKITIAGQDFYTNPKGQFAITTPQRAIYQLAISKGNYYQSVQTFSDYELSLQTKDTKLIAPISLVEKKQGRAMLSFGGDVMMGRRFYQPKFSHPVLINEGSVEQDSKRITKQIKPYMSVADYASVNLETQIASERPKQKAPKSIVFYTRPESLAALTWAGVDYVTLGNNHTYDFMDEGLLSTLNALKESGLGFSGAGFTEKEALAPQHTTINGVDYSMLGYVGWTGSFSPTQTATATKGGAAYGDEANIKRSVAAESAKNRTVVVQYHGSLEYASEPTVMTEQRLKLAVDNGADIAIAHHSHVTQGFEIYKGKLLAYSLGNFIFDQYFYATPHTFVLNVWMDGEQFHRAEIVPIYLKGYQPTPATGPQRAKLLKRMQTLSNKRNTAVSFSGGHAVILPQGSAQQSSYVKRSLPVVAGQKVVSIPANNWQGLLTQVDASDSSLRYRLGTELSNARTLESFSAFDSPERGWNTDSSDFELSNNKTHSGQFSLTTSIDGKAQETLAMTNFARVFNSGNPMTVDLTVNVEQATNVKVYWQGRKRKDKLNDALNNGKKHLIQSFDIDSNKGKWQQLSAHFNSPRGGYRGLRFIVEFENKSAKNNAIYVDDLSFIQWNSAFTAVNSAPISNELTSQASVIEFNRPLNKTDRVVLNYRQQR